MKQGYFETLSHSQKTAALFYHGVLLSSRDEKKHRVALFQLEGFYAEVYYSKKENRISHISTFSSVDALEPYLEGINISSLTGQL